MKRKKVKQIPLKDRVSRASFAMLVVATVFTAALASTDLTIITSKFTSVMVPASAEAMRDRSASTDTGKPHESTDLKADYRFQNTLASEQGAAPALTNFGTGNRFASESVDGSVQTVLAFPQGNGLVLSSTGQVIPSGTYSMVILFRFESTSGYRRILDLKNTSSDTGLYNLNGNLNFYNEAIGSSVSILPNEYVQVVLTRDAGKVVVGYVNGVQQFSFVDSQDIGVISDDNLLNIFRDDTVVSDEVSAGAIARLRFYNRALTAGEVSALDRLPGSSPTPSPSVTPTPTPSPSPGPICIPGSSFIDNFANGLDPARWTVQQTTSGLFSVDASQGDVRFTKTSMNSPGGIQNIGLKLEMEALGGPIAGDFSVEVDFRDAILGPAIDQVELHTTYADNSIFYNVYDNAGGTNVHVWNGSIEGLTRISNTGGALRISRSGSMLAAFYNDSQIFSQNKTGALTQVGFVLQLQPGSNDMTSVTFDNFSLTGANCSCGIASPADKTGWWKAEGNPNDSMGTNSGTLVGGTTYTTGKVGQAFNMNGTNAGVTIPHNTNLNINPGGFTAEFWMKANSTPSGQVLVIDKSHGFIDSAGWAFQSNPAGSRLAWFIGAGGGGSTNFVGLDSATNPFDGNFHHIAGTWDGTNLRLYMDGILQGERPFTSPVNNTRPVNFGHSWGGGTKQRWFNGILDEVAIYGRALSDIEIASAAGICPVPTPSPTPTPAATPSPRPTLSPTPTPTPTPTPSPTPTPIDLPCATGGFGERQDFSVGDFPVSIAVGDFNLDRKPDLAVANSQSDNISILFGNGSGHFGITTNYAVGNLPTSVAVGDLDRDGKTDLAVANTGSDHVSILKGKGDGTFMEAVSVASHFSTSVAIADLDLDGNLDIITTFVGGIAFRLGDGDGGFGPLNDLVVEGSQSSVVTGDFNLDDKPDLASIATSAEPNKISVFLGDRMGGFGSATVFESGSGGPGNILTGDFDNDDKLDLVTTGALGNFVSILRGNGDGSFEPAIKINVEENASAFSVTTADLNSDGNLDLATANGLGSASVLLGDGSGAFGPATNFVVANNPRFITASDLNLDGRPELITANAASSKISVLPNTCDHTRCAGTSFEITNFTAAGQPDAAAVGDFDLDGKLDIATANRNSDSLSVLLGDGTGRFGAPSNIIVGKPTFVAIGDLNMDSRPDLAVTSNFTSGATFSPAVVVFLGDGMGGFDNGTRYRVGADPYSVVSVDLDLDGKPDLATANLNSSNISVLLGDGSGGFSAAHNFTTGAAGPISITSGDFNLDGDPDLATGHPEGTVSVLLGDGAGGFGTPQIHDVGSIPFSIVTGDFDQDGDLDLATANYGDLFDPDSHPNTVSLLLGDGNGGFAPSEYFTVGSSPRSIAAVDLNLDGNLDLATANHTSNDISVLIGDGQGGFGSAANFAVGSSETTFPTGIAAGDLDLDGDPDLVSVSIGNGEVSVLFNTCGAGTDPTPTPTPTPDSSPSPTPTPNTETGANVTVGSSFGDATLTFSQVSAPGITTFTPINTSGLVETSPTGFTVLKEGPAYDISTTATFQSPVTICFTVSSINDPAEFARVRILHGEGGQPVDRTILAPDSPAPDFATRRVCAQVESLSPFVSALVKLPVSVEARIIDLGGRGIRNAQTRLVFSDGTTRSVASNQLGFVRFDNVPTGHTVTLFVTSKRFRFNKTEVLVQENLAEIVIVGLE